MTDTTIKVDSTVRDRLALLAAERGSTIRDLVAELATTTPTSDELDEQATAALTYIREHLNPNLADADVTAGRAFWDTLRTRGHDQPHLHR